MSEHLRPLRCPPCCDPKPMATQPRSPPPSPPAPLPHCTPISFPTVPPTTACPDGNLLCGQPSNASSVFSYVGVTCPPSRLTDGNSDGGWGGPSTACTMWHSTGDPSPWVEVPLPAPTRIGRVVLWNRNNNGFDDRIDGAIISGKDTDGILHACGAPLQTTGPGAAITRVCGSAVPFVSIRVDRGENTGVVLNFAELEAYAIGKPTYPVRLSYSQGPDAGRGGWVDEQHTKVKHRFVIVPNHHTANHGGDIGFFHNQTPAVCPQKLFGHEGSTNRKCTMHRANCIAQGCKFLT